MKEIKIYLAEWQKRMVKDYLGKDAKILTLSAAQGMIALYKAPLPTPEISNYVLMYLTDDQMTMIKDVLRTDAPCHYIEIGPDMPVVFS